MAIGTLIKQKRSPNRCEYRSLCRTKKSARDHLKTNAEASQEIARQLRLRNIGGIIIVDFIDMEEPAYRDQIYTDFSLALEKDPARTNITT